jgi:hypothetical protein
VSRFITELEVEEVGTSNEWKLLAPLLYASDLVNQVIQVPVNFVTDFASVPRIPLAFLLTGNTSHKAAVVHDYLYTTQPFSRSICDAILKEAILVCGEPAWRAQLMYLGVRIGGWKPWNRRAKDSTGAN